MSASVPRSLPPAESQTVLRIVLLAVLFAFAALPAQADSCSSVISGAQMGPSPNFNRWPWQNACYVSWPGGSRQSYEAKCRQVPGFQHFEGDYGSNKNTCIFTAPSAAAPRAPRETLADIDRRLAVENREGDRRALEEKTPIFKDLIARQAAAFETGDLETTRRLANQARDLIDNLSYTNSIFRENPNRRALATNQACIVSVIDNLTRNILFNSEHCALNRGVTDVAARLLLQLQQKQMDTPASGNDWYGAIAFAEDRRFFGMSTNKRTPHEAMLDAVDTCSAYQANTISTGMDTRTPCSAQLVTKNSCAFAYVSEDNQVAQTSFENSLADNGNGRDYCQQASGMTCRKVLAFCSKGPNN